MIVYEDDGLPSQSALRDLAPAGWAGWISRALREAQATDTPLEPIMRGIAKALDSQAEERHFKGAVDALEACINDLRQAAGHDGEPMVEQLAARVAVVLRHIAWTARLEFSSSDAGHRLASVVQGLLRSPRGFDLGCLQVLATLGLPEDVEFWRPFLDRPETAALAFECLTDRHAPDLPAALKRVVAVLQLDGWRLQDLLFARAGRMGPEAVRSLILSPSAGIPPAEQAALESVLSVK